MSFYVAQNISTGIKVIHTHSIIVILLSFISGTCITYGWEKSFASPILHALATRCELLGQNRRDEYAFFYKICLEDGVCVNLSSIGDAASRMLCEPNNVGSCISCSVQSPTGLIVQCISG